MNQDGSFRYTPAAGFTGTDSFTYTVSDAVRLYDTHLPPLGHHRRRARSPAAPTAPRCTRCPASCDEFYGLTDRGPNVDGPER